MKFKIRKGLNLPILGELSSQNIEVTKTSKNIAVIGTDFVGMKPTMLVNEGDHVEIGQALFECKKNVGVIYTSPAAGRVEKINRGARRVFESLMISVDAEEKSKNFENYKGKSVSDLTAEEVKALLIESGEWSALRQRPFEKVAAYDGKPRSIFITAMDTNPLALDPSQIIASRQEDFQTGAEVLAKLTEGKVFICHKEGVAIPTPAGDKFQTASFSGPHPAGNVGTHIHFVDPVSPNKYVWHASYQDVIAIGHLFKTGKLDLERVVALVGPIVKVPRVIKLRRGADLNEITQNELQEVPARIISGSVFNGRKSEGNFNYLGRYHNQITAIKEDATREFLGWQSPGVDKFSIKNIYVSKLIPLKKFAFTSNRNGSFRAVVPIGSYERVMPLDMLATLLVRSLMARDTDTAQDLGCLELAEEDMALLTFVDPGKEDFGPVLRENLTIIEKDG